MGIFRATLQAAIADLSRNGCDLTDPSSNDGDRADDARFYLGYLEEYCEFGLTIEEVLHAAQRMRRDRHAARHDVFAYRHAADNVGQN